MQVYALTLALLAARVAAYSEPAGHEYQAPGPDDSRAPCPMLNALANHGFLPRNGLDISEDVILAAFNESLNVYNSILLQAIDTAMTTSTTGNSSTFNLADTVKHDVIEHDASLSRQDYYFGDNLHFNAEVWANTTAFFTSDNVTVEQAAQARAARLEQAQAINPTFNLTSDLASFQLIETCLYLVILGGTEEGNPPVSWVESLFVEERLPYLEGFQRSDVVITTDDLTNMAAKVSAVDT